MLKAINAHRGLHWMPLVFCGFNAFVASMFAFSMFTPSLPKTTMLLIAGAAALIGLPIGICVKYRTSGGVTYGLWGYVVYLWMGLGCLAFGGLAGILAVITGHPEMRWMAFGLHVCLLTMALLAGLVMEARRLGFAPGSSDQAWRTKLAAYIDAGRNEISTRILDDVFIGEKTYGTETAVLIGAVGSANVVLMLRMFGGGVNNAVYLVAPLATLTFGHMSLKYFGPIILRLWLARRLESEQGRPFVNADFEQIQALRRTFILSRWLMTDYKGEAPSADKSRKMTYQARKKRRSA
jgi:hypothetical protein